MKYGALEQSDLSDQLTYDALGGMGFMQGVVIDAHFTKKGRQGRLWTVVLDTRHLKNGAGRGLGVDENTALVCEGQVCRVVGAGGVWGVDVGRAVVDRRRMRGARAFYITQGDVLRLSDWKVVFDSKKTKIVEGENAKVEASRYF